MRVLVVIFSLFTFSVFAQKALPQIEPVLSLAIPINEFAEADTTKQAYFGMGAEVTFPFLHDTPLRLGGSFRYYWMGSRERQIDSINPGGFQYELTTTVRGSMLPLHIHMRLDPIHYTNFPVLPYFGAFAGMRFFGTATITSVDYLDGNDPELDYDRKTSVTTSYGFEAGLHIRMTDYLLLDFRYERAYGGWAKYIDKGSIKIDDQGNASYKRLETRTDVEMFTLGLVVEID